MSKMTLKQMEAAGKRAEQIKAALAELAKAESNLTLLNQVPRERKEAPWDVQKSWCPTLILKKGDQNYGVPDITVRIDLPFGVVQQQLVYAVEAARRKVVRLGGTLP